MRYSEGKISGNFTARRMSVVMAGVVLGTLCLLPQSGMAQVQGQCSNCHTMHNSQNGAPMTFTGTTTVYRALTRGDCVGCHTGTSATDLVGNNIPKVNHTSEPSETLAGGSFYWVGTGATDNKGHNVLGIAGQDATLHNTPPGGSALASQLTCAGTTGCHGDRTVADQYAAISGGHHGAPENYGGVAGAVNGDTVAHSYRFLNGVKGIESSDWENPTNLTAGNHNQYYGIARTTDATVSGTISSLCGECHGAFHASATAHADDPTAGISYANNMTSPWVRHPTDFDMNTVKTKEYGNYGGSGVNAYQPLEPLGSNSIAQVNSKVLQASGDAIVLCVSCHRAHGSNQPDMLRWDYTTMNAGGGSNSNGCFACHTTKDDGV